MSDYRALEKWKLPEYYMGDTFYEYYVCIGKHRDSDLLTQSNFDVFLEALGGESEHVYIQRSNHWAVGWCETILIHEDAPEELLQEADDMLCALEQYPVLDDSDFSKRECEAEQEDFDNYLCSDLCKTLPDSLQEIVENESDLDLFQIYRAAMDSTNTYWDESGVDVNRIKGAFHEGILAELGLVECSHCEGFGYFDNPHTLDMPNELYCQDAIECEECEGKGYVKSQICDSSQLELFDQREAA